MDLTKIFIYYLNSPLAGHLSDNETHNSIKQIAITTHNTRMKSNFLWFALNFLRRKFEKILRICRIKKFLSRAISIFRKVCGGNSRARGFKALFYREKFKIYPVFIYIQFFSKIESRDLRVSTRARDSSYSRISYLCKNQNLSTPSE